MKRQLELEHNNNKKRKISPVTENINLEENFSAFSNSIISNCFIFLDPACLQIIFSYFLNTDSFSHTKETPENQETLKNQFIDCISFSRTCKHFYQISRQPLFRHEILKMELLLPFQIYQQITKIPESTFYDNENLIIYCSKNHLTDLIPTLKSLGYGFRQKDSLRANSLITDAIIMNDFQLTTSLISFGTDINHGSSPLLLAAKNGSENIFNYLISLGWDINTTDSKGNNSSHFCSAFSGDVNLFKHLMLLGCNINLVDHSGYNCLTLAAANGNLDIIKFLVEIGFDLNCRDKDGDNILTLAAMNGNLEIIKYLLSIGCNVNSFNNNGDNILTLAAMNGNLEIIKYLLSIGSDVNTVNNQGDNCLNLATLYVIEYLISVGCNPNCFNNNGNNCLTLAAYNGRIETLIFLVSIGCNIYTVNHFGRNCLTLAAMNGKIDILKYLIGLGYDINTVNNCLNVASTFGQVDVIKYLISIGCNVNTVDKNKNNCLMLAILNHKRKKSDGTNLDNLEIIKYLISLGTINLSLKNNQNQTALDLLKTQNLTQILQLFDFSFETSTSNSHRLVVMELEKNYFPRNGELPNFKGYWGEITSSLDWCESNYSVNFYVAEWWNTLSNALFILFGMYGAYLKVKNGFEKRFMILDLFVVVIGIGSTLFHMTLKLEAQLLDELPMLW